MNPKWQQPYTDAPIDPHHQARYDRMVKRDPDMTTRHVYRELTLMRMGRKPCAMIGDHLVAWEREAEFGGWQLHYGMNLNEATCVITVPGEHWRAARVFSIYRDCRLRGHMRPIDHARLGILFGYLKADIYDFLDRRAAT